MKNAGWQLFKQIDGRDILAILGLASIGYGFWLWKPFMAFIVIGLILFVLAINTTLRR